MWYAMLRRLPVITPVLFAFAAVAAHPAPAAARPVSAKGTTTLTTMGMHDITYLDAGYSLHRRVSLGASLYRTNRGLHHDRRDAWVYGPRLNVLAARINGDDYQFNVFAGAGAGGAFVGGRSGGGGFAELSTDFETVRIYAQLAGRFVTTLSADPRFDVFAAGRLGVAPYVADFDDLSAWIMVQVQVTPFHKQLVTVTPFVRLMYRSIQVELGVDLQGRIMAAFVADI